MSIKNRVVDKFKSILIKYIEQLNQLIDKSMLDKKLALLP